jgi:hypothetical protein
MLQSSILAYHHPPCSSSIQGWRMLLWQGFINKKLMKVKYIGISLGLNMATSSDDP